MSSLINPSLPLLEEFYDLADRVPIANYVRENGLDLAYVQAHAGILALIPCRHADGFFDFDDDGELSAVIEVLGEDAETVIDLVAWPVDRPHTFSRALGTAPVLGVTNVENPATWSLGKLCQIHRTPLQWLQAQCQGIVILDYSEAGPVLHRALGKFQVTDAEHQRELRQFLSVAPVPAGNFVVAPLRARRAA